MIFAGSALEKGEGIGIIVTLAGSTSTDVIHNEIKLRAKKDKEENLKNYTDEVT